MYPGWQAADQARFKTMLLTYFYPACNSFLTNHNNGCISRYWANWDTCNILAVMAIGVFCDDRDKFDQLYISANYHGRLDNCQYFELLYNHYVVMKGLTAPNIKRFAEVIRPESGNADLFGYGTLTYTLNAAPRPIPLHSRSKT